MKFLNRHAPALLALALVACRSERDAAAPREVRLAPVEGVVLERLESYPVTQRFVGRVEARQRSQLAFELAGTLEHVAVDEGEAITRGQPLAHIDTARLEAQRDELQAALDEARAARQLAEQVLARAETLVERNAVSVEQVDRARERATSAAANIDRIRAQRTRVEVDLAKSSLQAPFAGRVARRFADAGSVVAPNQPVLELLESAALEVRAALAAEALEGLAPGDRLRVELADDGVEELAVARILPARDPRTRTVDVILEVPAGVAGLRDGDFVSVRRRREVATDGFVLPRDALTESARGLWACFVLVPDPAAGGQARRLDRRDLELLHAEAGRVVVRGALEAGEIALAGGLHKVAPGQRVRLADTREGLALDESS